MTTVNDLDCTVTLGGVSQSGHIISCKRTGNLVEADTKFEIVLDETTSAQTVGGSCVIAEQGVTVLTGNIDAVHYSRQPEAVITVQGRDNFWRIQDYFIDDPLLQAEGETVAYWVGQLCSLAGISYTIPVGDGLQPVGSVASPVTLGMVFVIDSLRQLCALPGWSMRMTAVGVLEFVVLDQTGPADEIFTEFTGGNRTLGDQFTRNVAKVWGMGTDGNALLYQARVDIPGIVPDRIMLVSTPNIQTIAEAQALTTKLLAHFGNLDQIADLTLTRGKPTRKLGMLGQVTIEPSQSQLSILTDLESTVDHSGYQQAVSLGRKNFYLPYYPGGQVPPTQPPGTVLWQSGGSTGYIQRIIVGGGDLYMIGNWTDGATHPLAKNVRVEKRSIVDGSILWGANFTTAGAGLFGGDVVFDSAVYACMSGTAGIGSVASIEKLDASTGAIINTFSQSIGGTVGPNTNPMAQDSTDLFMGVGSVGTRKVDKSTLTGGATFGTYLDQSIEANSNFFILDDGDVLRKSDKTSGYTTNSSALGYPLIGHEISLTGQKVYRLIGNQIGVGGPWEVRRFSVGAVASDPITQDWVVSGPNNDLLSGGAWKRGIQAGDTKLVIGLNYLYTAFLSLVDGSVLFDVTGSANSTDYFSSCVQSGGVCYSAGAKNGQWYVEARVCP